MARKFLYIVAGVTVLMLLGAFALTIWSAELTKLALVPHGQVRGTRDAGRQCLMPIPRCGSNGRARAKASRAGSPIGTSGLKEGRNGTRHLRQIELVPEDYAVFFVHPTSYVNRASWNAPLDDADANRTARIYIKGMASPFANAREIWVPRYRQATIGAFLTDAPRSAIGHRCGVPGRGARLPRVRRQDRSRPAHRAGGA